MSAISVLNLCKSFRGGTQALKNVCFDVSEGEMVALIGASGSGKSTLIRHVAGLIESDKTQSSIEVFGSVIQKDGKVSKTARGSRTEIGVVFQQFNLVGRLSVLTNVLMGVLGRAPSIRTVFGIFTKEEKQLAMDALARVGIDRLATQKSSNLSGGQQQRAAIARTIVQGAKLILADEPIASLDPASSRKVMDNLQRINQQDGATVLVSLHQVDYAKTYCPRTIAMRDGEIVFDGPSEELTPSFLRELYGDESIELIQGKAPEITPAKTDVLPAVGIPSSPALAQTVGTA